MPGEQVHAPLPTDNAAQAVMATTKIDRLDREIDPDARWQSEQRLPKPADYGGDVRGIAPLLEAKPKAGAELELDLLGSSAAHTHRQQRQSLALDRGRAGRLVQVVLQCRVGHAMFGGDLNAGNGAFSRLRHNSLPKIQLHALVIETSRARINPLGRRGNDTQHRTDTNRRPPTILTPGAAACPSSVSAGGAVPSLTLLSSHTTSRGPLPSHPA